MFLWTAFTIGLLGSMHCVGMCSPIALSLRYTTEDKPQSKWWGMLLYNGGRLCTYSALGLGFGLLGRGLYVAQLQQLVAILIGLGLLLALIFSFNIEKYLLQHAMIGRAYFFLKKQLARRMQQPTRSSLFTIGVLNGFLPCGLVYMAVLGAVSTNSPLYGMLYMALFGLGTFPLMLLAGFSGQLIGVRFRRFFQKAYPWLLAGFALLFLLRGFSVELPRGIVFWEALQREAVMCN